MKRTPLPKQKVTLTFVPNKWNRNLLQAQVDGRNVADINYWPEISANVPYHLYTDVRGQLIDEGQYPSRSAAEGRANWRVNL